MNAAPAISTADAAASRMGRLLHATVSLRSTTARRWHRGVRSASIFPNSDMIWGMSVE
jgi:hypothetical protein